MKQYTVILVQSSSHAMRIEHMLNQKGVASKLIPVPRHLSSDCGLCVQIEKQDVPVAQEVVKASRLDIQGFFDL
jgi:hypothetical protein